MSLPAFLCDISETTEASDCAYLHGVYDYEQRVLRDARVRNVILADAVFRELADGRSAPRDILLPARVPHAGGLLDPTALVDAVLAYLRAAYALADAPEGERADLSRRVHRAYASTLHELSAEQTRADAFVKRRVLERVCTRVLAGDADAAVAFLATRPAAEPLHVTYAMLHVQIMKRAPGAFYAHERQLRARITRLTKSAVPSVGTLDATLPSWTTATSHEPGSETEPTFFTTHEFFVRCYARDAHFLHHASRLRPFCLLNVVGSGGGGDNGQKRFADWVVHILRYHALPSSQHLRCVVDDAAVLKGHGNDDNDGDARRRSVITSYLERSCVKGSAQMRLLLRADTGELTISEEGGWQRPVLPWHVGAWYDTGVVARNADDAAPPEWWTDLCGVVAKNHVLAWTLPASMGSAAHAATAKRMDKTGAFHAFLLSCFQGYRHRWRRPSSRASSPPPPPPRGEREAGSPPSRAVVLLDNRANPLSVAAVYVTTRALVQSGPPPPGTWTLLVICSDLNEGYFRHALAELLAPGAPGWYVYGDAVHFVRHEALCGRNAFSIEDYNALLKSESMWTAVCSRMAPRGARCLLIQDDGMLVRPRARGLRLEEDVMRPYQYAGAPWLEGQTALQRASTPDLVGNGGFSSRCPHTMLSIARSAQRDGGCRALFSVNYAQPEPEDVFFSRSVAQTPGAAVAPRHIAAAFSCEQGMSDDTMGFHKPWPYGDVDHARAFFSRLARRVSEDAE